jgi:Ni/Fe-hydrogenase 1 B-type cytochrome subunit
MTPVTTRPEAAREPAAPAYAPVYIWHWPVRVFHWAMAVSVVVLAVTGLYIGQPYFVLAPRGTTPFLMGSIRFLHFVAAYVLMAAALLRVYALFAGNRYERWASLLPHRKKDWVDLARMLRKYVLSDWWSPPHYLGHNPLQQVSYTFVYLVLLFQIVTGFALYGQARPGGFWWTLTTSWVMPLLGGNQYVRLSHHLALWVLAVFVVLHVYLAVRSDVLYDRGAISSIISGYKYKHARIRYEDA